MGDVASTVLEGPSALRERAEAVIQEKSVNELENDFIAMGTRCSILTQVADALAH
jgi:hypothetical protein